MTVFAHPPRAHRRRGRQRTRHRLQRQHRRSRRDRAPSAGYGEPGPRPGRLLSLPPGFSYRIVAAGRRDPADDGPARRPSDPDGTGCFAHAPRLDAGQQPRDRRRRAVRRARAARPHLRPGRARRHHHHRGRPPTATGSASTSASPAPHNNCAGGITPWGTWLTCEETEQRAGGAFQKDHGYVFEVDPFEPGRQPAGPVPLKFLGRYAHEAVAVDPATHAIYLTEDAGGPNGLYFRWTPPQGFRGRQGRAARARAQSTGGDTAGRAAGDDAARRAARTSPTCPQATEPGTTYKVSGSTCPTGDAATSRCASSSPTTRSPAAASSRASGGATAARTSSPASPAPRDGSVNEHDGQVWFYDPAHETVTLKTIFGVNPDPTPTPTTSTGRTTSPSRRTAASSWPRTARACQHLVGVTDAGQDLPAGPQRAQRQRVRRPDVQPRRPDPVRQHPVARPRLRDHRPLGTAEQRPLARRRD